MKAIAVDRKIAMLEAVFKREFTKPVNKTAFLYLDFAASNRYQKNERMRNAYRDFLLERFFDYAGKNQTKKTWREAIRWFAEKEEEVYRSFRETGESGRSLGAH